MKNITIILNNKTYNVNELTTEHFNTTYYDDNTGFDYTIEIDTYYIINTKVHHNEKVNRLTYLALKALGNDVEVIDQWKEIIKHYIYD